MELMGLQHVEIKYVLHGSTMFLLDTFISLWFDILAEMEALLWDGTTKKAS